jgi:hypothetical protein
LPAGAGHDGGIGQGVLHIGEAEACQGHIFSGQGDLGQGGICKQGKCQEKCEDRFHKNEFKKGISGGAAYASRVIKFFVVLKARRPKGAGSRLQLKVQKWA